MSDVEMVLQRNWEQRRWAEEVEAEEGCKVIQLEEHRIGGQESDRSAERKAKKKNRKRILKAARVAGHMALVMSAASAFAGMELLFPLFLTVAVIFYALHFELKGRCGVWHKMI